MKITSNIPASLLPGIVVTLRPYVQGLSEHTLLRALQAYEPDTPTAPKPQPRDDRSLGMGQIASRWSCGKALVRRHIHSGELPARKLGHRTVRVTESDLLEFEAKQGITPATVVEATNSIP